jgi:hypothetical protein
MLSWVCWLKCYIRLLFTATIDVIALLATDTVWESLTFSRSNRKLTDLGAMFWCIKCHYAIFNMVFLAGYRNNVPDLL